MKYLNFKNRNGLLWLVFCLGVVLVLERYPNLLSLDGGDAQNISTQARGTGNELYPTGFLEILDAKGHAIEDHVAKSDNFLFERLARERISAASTFNSYAEAEASIRAVLLDRKSLVQAWLNTEKSNKKAFYTPFAKPIGRIVKRGWNASRAGNQARVVLIRDASYDTGFFILTAYPEYR